MKNFSGKILTFFLFYFVRSGRKHQRPVFLRRGSITRYSRHQRERKKKTLLEINKKKKKKKKKKILSVLTKTRCLALSQFDIHLASSSQFKGDGITEFCKDISECSNDIHELSIRERNILRHF